MKQYKKRGVGKVALTVLSVIVMAMGVFIYHSQMELKTTSERLDKAQIKIEHMKKEISSAKAENKRLDNEIYNLQQENEKLMQQYQAVLNENSKLKREIKAYKNAIGDARKKHYSDSDIKILEQLVTAEAKGEPLQGMVAVVDVVLNRVKSDKFPDTIHDVIYEDRQFSPVIYGTINNNPTPEAKKAVQIALHSPDITNGALYFYNDSIAPESWLSIKQTTARIGHHVFKK